MRFLPATLTTCLLVACLVIAAPLPCTSPSKGMSRTQASPSIKDEQHSLAQSREPAEGLFSPGTASATDASPKTIVQRSIFSAAKKALKTAIVKPLAAVSHQLAHTFPQYAAKGKPPIGSIVHVAPEHTNQPRLKGENGKTLKGANIPHPAVVIGHSLLFRKIHIVPISHKPPEPHVPLLKILTNKIHGNIHRLGGNAYVGPADDDVGGPVKVHVNHVSLDKNNRHVNPSGIQALKKYLQH